MNRNKITIYPDDATHEWLKASAKAATRKIQQQVIHLLCESRLTLTKPRAKRARAQTNINHA